MDNERKRIEFELLFIIAVAKYTNIILYSENDHNNSEWKIV